MKKKWLMFGGAVGISSVVMLSTGFSALANTSGYDSYKAALKNTRSVQNVSVQAAAALQDNGNVLANAAGNFKVNISGKTASGSADLTANGTKQSVSFYKQNNQVVVKSGDSDVYYVNQEGQEKRKNKNETPDTQMSQQVETVIDALVGNLKDYVTVDAKADGSKEIAVQLDNAQIPAVVNAIAPIAINHATKPENSKDQKKENNKNEIPFKEDVFKGVAPHLTQDIKIDKVSVKAEVNSDNLIQHQEADVTVSGKDDNGTAHSLTVHLQADLSGFNSTTPDTIDLTGKTVQQVKHDKGNRYNENE